MGIIFSLFKQNTTLHEDQVLAMQALGRGYKARTEVKAQAGKVAGATLLQSLWRGHSIRRFFGFTQLSATQKDSCPTYVVGNDPIIKVYEY